ncbi:MAG TPA: glycosyl transferase family 1, partial [Peptococcaceae bacterium]|nr:glycosyl transferase family 1 [Peptococcaceae bacterium]
MEIVNTAVKNYKEYEELIDVDTRLQLEYFAEKLKGKRIAMVNATAFGGGVAEILHSLVPLLRSLKIDIDWWIMDGSDEFFI